MCIRFGCLRVHICCLVRSFTLCSVLLLLLSLFLFLLLLLLMSFACFRDRSCYFLDWYPFLKRSTSPPGGNQVDGLPPALSGPHCMATISSKITAQFFCACAHTDTHAHTWCEALSSDDFFRLAKGSIRGGFHHSQNFGVQLKMVSRHGISFTVN